MKYLDEFRDPELAASLFEEIRGRCTRPWVMMEVCGGQTHSIIRNGIDTLLPPEVELVHGPGCPVCVTPLETIDKALAIASQPGVIFCSFGDMLRVPGSDRDLLTVKSAGGDVRIVYSPLDAFRIAQQNPDRQVVFFGIGFETTAPANAMAVYLAKKHGLTNFSMLVSHVLVPPAIAAICSSPTTRVQAFLAAGHVCSVMGYAEYEPLAAEFDVPIVVTGFEPLDVLEGIRRTVLQLEQGRAEVENAYPRAVQKDGNPDARRMLEDVFQVMDRNWRGIGMIPARVGSSPTSTASSTPPIASPSRTSRPRSPRSVVPGRCSKDCSSRTNVRRSARSAPRGSRSAPRWSPPRAPAPRTSRMEGWRPLRRVGSPKRSRPLRRRRRPGDR